MRFFHFGCNGNRSTFRFCLPLSPVISISGCDSSASHILSILLHLSLFSIVYILFKSLIHARTSCSCFIHDSLKDLYAINSTRTRSHKQQYCNSKMALGLLLPIRIAQAVFAVVVLGLSGYVAHWYNADTLTASPSQINFLIFVPIFTLISVLYLEVTPRFMSKASHPYAHFAFELLNVLFYFAGFIALSVFLSKLLFCRGSVCAAARADAAFGAFSWLLWLASSAILAMEMFKGGRSRSMPQPNMAMKETTNPV